MFIKSNSNETIDINVQKTIMVDMLQEFIKYCDMHDLQYFLAGGTLIGAIRHSGYIPWDDDIDIMMPKPDYDRFLELSKETKIAPNIEVSNYQINDNHIWIMTKIFNTKTCLIEPNVIKSAVKKQEDFSGLYLDIFPLYGLPNNEQKRIEFLKKIMRIKKRYTRAIRKINYKNPLVHLFYYIMRIPYKLIGYKKYIKKMDRMINKYKYDDSNYVALSYGVYGLKDNLNREYFKDFTYKKFENLNCKVPVSYDKLLTEIYGDYMELPPVSQRKGHPRLCYYRD